MLSILVLQLRRRPLYQLAARLMDNWTGPTARSAASSKARRRAVRRQNHSPHYVETAAIMPGTSRMASSGAPPKLR
jgi:hypothetical protein